MTVTYNLNLRWSGPSWKNCGDTGGQKDALASDQAFQKTLTSAYGTEFGTNMALMNNLTSNLGQIVNAGASQQGFSPAELAAKNSQAINSAAASNQKLQTVIGENAATHSGGAPGVESGIVQAERAAAATQVDTGLNNTEAGITQQNYDVGRQNYWNAVKGQEEAPSAFESPINQAGSDVNTGNQNTDTQANANAASSTGTELLGLGEGLASDAATVAGCVTQETLVTMKDGTEVPASDLQVRDVLQGLDDDEFVTKLELSIQPVVKVVLEDGSDIIVSDSHTFATPSGGYVEAAKSANKILRTINGYARVVSAEPAGKRAVIRISLSGTHAYISNKIWSLE